MILSLREETNSHLLPDFVDGLQDVYIAAMADAYPELNSKRLYNIHLLTFLVNEIDFQHKMDQARKEGSKHASLLSTLSQAMENQIYDDLPEGLTIDSLNETEQKLFLVMLELDQYSDRLAELVFNRRVDGKEITNEERESRMIHITEAFNAAVQKEVIDAVPNNERTASEYFANYYKEMVPDLEGREGSGSERKLR